MNSPDYNPFADEALPQTPARALPWATIMGASLLTTVPLIATMPLLPPFGLLVLLAWRLLARFSLRMWAAAPLGAFDDLVSGQPLGSAVLLWSLCFLAIDLVEQRMIYRDFWQDWLIAGGAIAFCLSAGRLIAVPIGTHVDSVLLLQIVMSVMLFPLAARFVAWLDRKRGPA